MICPRSLLALTIAVVHILTAWTLEHLSAETCTRTFILFNRTNDERALLTLQINIDHIVRCDTLTSKHTRTVSPALYIFPCETICCWFSSLAQIQCDTETLYALDTCSSVLRISSINREFKPLRKTSNLLIQFNSRCWLQSWDKKSQIINFIFRNFKSGPDSKRSYVVIINIICLPIFRWALFPTLHVYLIWTAGIFICT